MAGSYMQDEKAVHHTKSSKLFKYIIGCHDSRKFLMKIGECYCLNLLRCMENTVRSSSIKGRGGIRNKVRVKVEVASHTRRRLDTVVGR